MTALNYANLWSSELTGAITNSALSCGVISTAGSPAVPFRARIRAEGANKDEIVTVTAKTGTLTIERAAEAIGDGTQVAQAHASGATIEAVLTAGLIDQLVALSGGVSGKAPVQDKGGGAGTSTNALAITLGATPTNGNLLIACIDRDATGAITSITQTNVTWTQLISSGNGTAPVVEIWKGVVGASAGTTLTIYCATTTYTGVHVSEWNGITGTIDQSAHASGVAYSGGLGLPRTPILIPTAANALVIGACSSESNGTKYTTYYGMVQFEGMLAQGSTCCSGFAFPGTTPVRLVPTQQNGTKYSACIVSLT